MGLIYLYLYLFAFPSYHNHIHVAVFPLSDIPMNYRSPVLFGPVLFTYGKVEVNVKFTLEQAMKAQSG